MSVVNIPPLSVKKEKDIIDFSYAIETCNDQVFEIVADAVDPERYSRLYIEIEDSEAWKNRQFQELSQIPNCPHAGRKIIEMIMTHESTVKIVNHKRQLLGKELCYALIQAFVKGDLKEFPNLSEWKKDDPETNSKIVTWVAQIREPKFDYLRCKK